MSDSTTQQKQSNKAAANGAKQEAKEDAPDTMSAFEREMQKKIRNKVKKLEKI